MFRFGDPGSRVYNTLGTSNVNILAWWTTLVGTVAVQTSGGRVSGNCLAFERVNASNPSYLTKTLTSQQTWGLAFAYKPSSIGGGGYQIVLASFYDVTTSQVDLRLNADGTLSVTRNGTVLGTSSFSLSASVWCHIEFKVKIDPSVGTVEVRVNGTAVIGPLTSLNTRVSSNSSANVIYVGVAAMIPGSGNIFANDFWDDIIVWDTQTTDANGFTDISDFIGDCGLFWSQPNGAGTTTNFTADSGSNYARVNEATPDGDTSYVQDSTVSDIDTYAMADISGASTIKSVAVVLYARRTDIGARGIKSELRSGGGNTSHATAIVLGLNYQYYFQNWGQNPNNGSATNWTPTSVNAVESGQIISS